MNNNDIRTREELRQALQQAAVSGDTGAFSSVLDEMMQRIGLDIQAEYEQRFDDLRQEVDSRILAQRGVHQLTSEERSYYQKLAAAMRSTDPRQAVTGLDETLPKTVINSVFDELQTAHPLLSRINFRATGGAVEIMVNTNGYEEAVWGELCDDIVKELTAGIKKISTTLLKLSAFLPVCKAMLELGAEWLDSFIRQTLYEALSNGMEAGIVAGDGNKKPIGMIRQVGDGVTVTGGAYPEKAAVKVDDLSPHTVGNLLSIVAADPNGKPRRVRDVILLVNPQDYLQKVMPATTLMAPDGTYRNDVLPYPMDIIQTHALPRGKAVIGIAYRYLAMAGTSPEGRIEYSDHYRFLEDERVYLIKAYANGMELFVQLEKNADGSRAFQCGGDMQEGQAYWNTDAVPLPEKFPWVEIETQVIAHEAVMDGEKTLLPAFTRLEVVSAGNGEEIPVETAAVPTQLDRVEAQATYTAMMTDTLMEV